MMSGLRFIPEPIGGRPRTITHAMELLRDKAGPSPPTAKISVGPRLPTLEPAWSFCLYNEQDETTYAVLLPACAKVRAIRAGVSQFETFDIQDLHEATVDLAGLATLKNDLRIRAIEAELVNLSQELSKRDGQIFHALIEIIDGQDWAYRSLRQGLPLKYQRMVPDHRFIDFSALKIGIVERKIKIPLLKTLQYQMSERFQVTASLQKISDTLRKTGIRTNRSMRV
jgi:hypothetical protein